VTSKISVRTVAADSNVLLSAVAGRAARRVFASPLEIQVLTTEANLAEVVEYLPVMAKKYGIPLLDLHRTLALLPVEVVDERQYQGSVGEAETYLAKRDPDDVPLAALALSRRIPIWSNDKDFEEVPLPRFTTGQLLAALGL